jgi:hypothetical protein
LREGAFAGTQIGNHHGRQQHEQTLRKRLPGASWYILPPEAPRKFIEIGAGLVQAIAQNQLERLRVALSLGDFLRRFLKHFKQLRMNIGLQAVENVLAGAAVFNEAGLLQLG